MAPVISLKKAKQTDLERYIKDHYGTCSQANKCRCNATANWIGQDCKNWTPVEAKTWGELMPKLCDKETK